MHPKGAETRFINVGGSSSRLTHALSVATDGTKLLLFDILEGMPRGSVEKLLPSIFPARIVAFVQQKAWMDARTMQILNEKVFKHHVSGCKNRAGISLDDLFVIIQRR